MRWLPLVGLVALAGCHRTRDPAPADPRPRVAAAPASEPDPNSGVPDWVPPLPAPPTRPAPPPALAAIDLDGGIELPGDGGTVNGNPHGPKASALNQVIRSAEPAIQACLDGAELDPGATTQVQVGYRIMPDGRTSDVQVATSAPPPAVDCLRRTVSALRFPTFEGEPVAGSFPYAYRRR